MVLKSYQKWIFFHVIIFGSIFEETWHLFCWYKCVAFAFYHTSTSAVGHIIVQNICCLSQPCGLIEDLLLSLSLWFSLTNKMWVEVTCHFHIETIKAFIWFHTIFSFLNAKGKWNNKSFSITRKKLFWNHGIS